MDISAVFNKALTDFVADMSTVYEGAHSLSAALNLAIVVDRHMPMAMFNEHVTKPYAARIETRDEAFLLERDFTSQLKTVAAQPPGLVDIVGQLKTVWRTLSDENKEAIWAHLAKLVAMSKFAQKNQT